MKSRLLFFICFAVTFGAGLAVGMLWSQPPLKQPPPRDPFMSELNLTMEQRDQIKAFWTEAMKNNTWQMQREMREAAQKERDESFKALLTDEQKTKQDEIQQKFQGKMEEMNLLSKRARDEAYEKTKTVLTPEQLVKYEEMRKKRFEGRDGREGHGPGGPPHGGFGPGGPGGPGPSPSGDSPKGKSKDGKGSEF